MIIDISDPANSFYSYVTLDGIFVPICQYADDEAGIVRFPAMSNEYGVYFDYKAEDFVILERRGCVVIHKQDSAEEIGKVVDEFVKAGNFLKPSPEDIPPTAKARNPVVRFF